MRPIKGKSKIYNICLKHISTVNSFVYDDGINHFEPMVETLEKYLHSERLKWNKEMREMIEKEIEYSKSHHEVVLENWEEDKSDVFKSKSEVRGFLIALDAFKELLEQLEEKK